MAHASHCRDHPNVLAIVRCGTCSRGLCDPCFRFRLNEKPSCARCAYEASTRPARRASLAATFLCFVWGGELWAARHYGLWQEHPVFLVLLAAVTPVVAYFIQASGSGVEAALENREPGEDPNETFDEAAMRGSGSPFRATMRRALLAASPRVSGRATALVMGACFLASAVLLPAGLHLPPWVEAEIVLGTWWLVVFGALTTLLYRGFRLRDDHVYFLPWMRPAASERGGAANKSSGWGWGPLDGCSGMDVGDGEGCIAAIVMLVVLAIGFGAAWIFVEIAMPLVFLLMYLLLMRGIGRVARDHRECAGDASRSVRWGALWATIYVAPIGLVTWLFHVARAHH